ncbi:hypothetical protein MRX96_059854 [Rhipicephalus microplus]
MYGDLAERTQVFSDGSVWRDASAAAAWTTAEVVGLLLTADLLRESPAVRSAAIFCDTEPALSQLAREERGPLLAQRAARSLMGVLPHEVDLRPLMVLGLFLDLDPKRRSPQAPSLDLDLDLDLDVG